jgi:hypothetical protein
MTLAIDHDFERLFKPHMPDEFIFKYYIQTVQVINIIVTLIYIRIYCEITYPE